MVIQLCFGLFFEISKGFPILNHFFFTFITEICVWILDPMAKEKMLCLSLPHTPKKRKANNTSGLKQ